ncbi:MAG: YkgJ family cysteine cluster protein [Poseidonibacter sp.]
MNKLNCEQCAKTKNHCCKADIPLEVPIALSLILIAEKKGFENLSITEHPRFKERAVIINKSWVKDNQLDLMNQECAFLADGKCGIYEDRPDICRLYGTKYIRCRWECSNIQPKQIEVATMEDIKYFDEVAAKESLISKRF